MTPYEDAELVELEANLCAIVSEPHDGYRPPEACISELKLWIGETLRNPHFNLEGVRIYLHAWVDKSHRENLVPYLHTVSVRTRLDQALNEFARCRRLEEIFEEKFGACGSLTER